MTANLCLRLHSAAKLVQQLYRCRNVGCRTITLHLATSQNDFQARIPTRDYMQHIPNCRARWRGHESEPPRVFRQRLFSFLGEKTFGFQLLLQFLESDLERAESLQFDGGDTHLVLAPRLID